MKALCGGLCIPVTNWPMKSDRKFKTYWMVFRLHMELLLKILMLICLFTQGPWTTMSLLRSSTTVQGINLFMSIVARQTTWIWKVTLVTFQCADCRKRNKERSILYLCSIVLWSLYKWLLTFTMSCHNWLISTSGTARPHGLPPPLWGEWETMI